MCKFTDIHSIGFLQRGQVTNDSFLITQRCQDAAHIGFPVSYTKNQDCLLKTMDYMTAFHQASALGHSHSQIRPSLSPQ